MVIYKELNIKNIFLLHNFLYKNRNDINFFNPHKFNLISLFKILLKNKKDIYILQFYNKKLIGYGMLRGWDEGYIIPSLGIIIDKEYRNKNYSNLLMEYLHDIVINKGYDEIRLKVNKDNKKAINLYKKFGYDLMNYNEKYYIGYKLLK